MKRYYVANQDGIPIEDQPISGYTYLQSICRVQREIEHCIKLFGGEYNNYKDLFTVLDNNFNDVKDAKLAY